MPPAAGDFTPKPPLRTSGYSPANERLANIRTQTRCSALVWLANADRLFTFTSGRIRTASVAPAFGMVEATTWLVCTPNIFDALTYSLQIVNEKRSIGVGGSPPHLTALVPLHGNVDVGSLSESIRSCALSDGSLISASPLISAGYTANLPRLRHRFQVRPLFLRTSDLISVQYLVHQC